MYRGIRGRDQHGIAGRHILQQTSNFETPDARIFGFFGILVAVLVIVEGATQLAHSQIQVGALVFNRALGTGHRCDHRHHTFGGLRL